MKLTFKILTGIFFLPFLAIAFIGAIIKLTYTLTVMFTIDLINEWHDKMLFWVDDKVKRLKD